MGEKMNTPHTEDQSEAETMPERDEVAEQIESLKKQLEGERARAEENLRHWQRAQADYVNYKRRVEQERNEFGRYANAVLISRLLPLLDDFDRAEQTLPESLHHLSWIEGVFLIRMRLQALLRQEGLQPIEAFGKEFDPVLHEAVAVEPGVDVAQGKVVEEFQTGYRLHERILRPSLVKVGPAEQKASTESEATESQGT